MLSKIIVFSAEYEPCNRTGNLFLLTCVLLFIRQYSKENRKRKKLRRTF